MYQKIVLAFDGSHEARLALREGALLAIRYQATVWLLCVLPDNTALTLAEGIQPGAAEHLFAASNEMVQEGLGKLSELGLSATGHVARGEPATTIATFARDVGADLVVLGPSVPQLPGALVVRPVGRLHRRQHRLQPPGRPPTDQRRGVRRRTGALQGRDALGTCRPRDKRSEGSCWNFNYECRQRLSFALPLFQAPGGTRP